MREWMPSISLNDDARRILTSYKWPGNIRQLKNITEQISIIEESRIVTPEVLMRYLPDYSSIKLPALLGKKGFVDEQTFASEREILYKVLFDMRNDVNDLKKLVLDLMRNNPDNVEIKKESSKLLNNLYNGSDALITPVSVQVDSKQYAQNQSHIQDTEEIVEESLSLEDKEIEFIKKALEKHKGKRKMAANELGISERTLYRKIKEHNLD